MAAKDEKQVVKFTRDYEVQDEKAGTDQATRYKKGQRVSLPLASAEHFLNRSVAEIVRRPAKR